MRRISYLLISAALLSLPGTASAQTDAATYPQTIKLMAAYSDGQTVTFTGYTEPNNGLFVVVDDQYLLLAPVDRFTTEGRGLADLGLSGQNGYFSFSVRAIGENALLDDNKNKHGLSAGSHSFFVASGYGNAARSKSVSLEVGAADSVTVESPPPTPVVSSSPTPALISSNQAKTDRTNPLWIIPVVLVSALLAFAVWRLRS